MKGQNLRYGRQKNTSLGARNLSFILSIEVFLTSKAYKSLNVGRIAHLIRLNLYLIDLT